MVDEEVENILSQIRERVRAQPQPSAFADATRENAGGDSLVSTAVATPLSSNAWRESGETLPTEARERIESYLTTTSRAWNRLPPLVSNRSGSSARLELWVKRQIKRATHWFTWEQINFNAAAHHAIRDMLETLSDFEQELGKLRAETKTQRQMLEQGQGALKEQKAETETLRKENESLRAEIQTQRAEVEKAKAEFETHRAALEAQSMTQVEAQRKELDARLSELTREMQDRLERMTDEQRVCFKQLSLEATEASVLEDRARRKTESLLEEFRGRLAQIESK